MAVFKAVNTRSSTLRTGISYVSNLEKTEAGLISGKDCNQETALAEMQATKELYGKTDGRQYKHFIQSFDPNDPIDYIKAHELGKEFAEKAFPGHEVLIATHKDKDHIHNHFIVNSVNFENGSKFQMSKADLQNMKDLNDQMCEREGLSIIREKTPGKEISMNEYQAAVQGKSWKFRLMADIDQAIERSQNKAEFIKAMEDKGYKVNWTDTRKYITYTTPDGNKVRDNKLHDPKYLKEAMENGFERSERNQLPTGEIRTNGEHNLSGDRNQTGEITRTTNDLDKSSNSGQKRISEEVRREREGTDRDPREGQSNIDGTTGRDEKHEKSKLSNVGQSISDSDNRGAKESRNQRQNGTGNYEFSVPGQEHSKTHLEGKGETIHNTTSSDRGDTGRDHRRVSSGNYLDEILKSIGNSIEKEQQKENAKAERERRLRQGKKKTRSQDMEWER